MLDMDVFLVCLSTTDHRKHACVCVCCASVPDLFKRQRENHKGFSAPGSLSEYRHGRRQWQ